MYCYYHVGDFYSVCETVGVKKKSWYAAIALFGMMLVATTTGLLFSFKPISAMVIGLISKGTGIPIEVDFLSWLAFQFIWSVTVIAVYTLVAKFIFRPDVSALKEAGKNFAHLRNQKMNGDQKVAAVVLIIFLLIMILPSVLPATVPGMALLKNINAVGGMALCMVGLAILKNKEGQSISDMTHLLSKGVNWTIALLLGATMPLGDALGICRGWYHWLQWWVG